MIISNVNLVLKDEVIHGAIEVIDGVITDISQTQNRQSDPIDPKTDNSDLIDGQGGYLIPGLIELHTDNLEKHFTPRPKVDWPAMSAMKAHDVQLIGAGITTVLDAIAVGYAQDANRQAHLDLFVNTVIESQKRQLTRAEHKLHLRCEVPNDKTIELFERYAKLPELQLVSLMDHAPGQRQFVDIEKYRTYYQGKYGMNAQEMQAFESSQIDESMRWSKHNRDEICRQCRALNLPTASHDDATVEHVDESLQLGMVIAEFPTTIEAAQRSHQLGLKVMMGAPNVIRGGSHSGNVAAHQLASLGVLDILSSDYYPASLLDAIVMLAHDERNPMDLPQAVQLATRNPAQALGLNDRGEIALGKRADLVLFQQLEEQPMIEQVWRQGVRVF